METVVGIWISKIWEFDLVVSFSSGNGGVLISKENFPRSRDHGGCDGYLSFVFV